MRTRPRYLLLIAAATIGSSVLAAGESYMSLVGQLYGAVELPRLAKDYCGSAQPSLKSSITTAYESWERRNESFLTKSREQFSRANARMKKEGASLTLMDDVVRNQFRSLDAKQLEVAPLIRTG
jgi:hypothetical protein